MMNKIWTIEEIRRNLETSNIWVSRAIVTIFNFQTQIEKTREHTINRNNVGFSAFDAKRLSYYAKWILSGRELNGRHINIACKKIIRYSKQLVNIANKV